METRLDMPYESCGLDAYRFVVLMYGFLTFHIRPGDMVWFSEGIASFLVLFEFGLIWEGLDFEVCLEVPNRGKPG